MTFSFLMNLELRLHLAAEDVDAALEMDSARALQRIPAAIQETLHLRVPSGSLPWCELGCILSREGVPG